MFESSVCNEFGFHYWFSSINLAIRTIMSRKWRASDKDRFDKCCIIAECNVCNVYNFIYIVYNINFKIIQSKPEKVIQTVYFINICSNFQKIRSPSKFTDLKNSVERLYALIYVKNQCFSFAIFLKREILEKKKFENKIFKYFAKFIQLIYPNFYFLFKCAINFNFLHYEDQNYLRIN